MPFSLKYFFIKLKSLVVLVYQKLYKLTLMCKRTHSKGNLHAKLRVSLVSLIKQFIANSFIALFDVFKSILTVIVSIY